MTTTNLSAVAQAIRGPFQQSTQEFEPLRPELYRYCRYLTRTPWDAEDLVQDTMVRGFVLLGTSHGAPVHPKAWLFRVASNRWLNLCKQRHEEPNAETADAAHTPVDPKATREAAGSLVTGLALQERAALVLKEVFDFSLEEISQMLSTTVGGVKSALNRARGLNEFCSAFNARDLDKVVSLPLETVEVELSGTFVDSGLEVAKRSFGGLMFATKMRGVSLLTAEGNHITRIKTYMHSPELLAEVCRELGEAFRSNGYRNWETQVLSAS